jgi:hypothetical protein
MVQFAAGVSTLGNTQGNTGTRFGTFVLAGTNNVTLSQITGSAGVHTIQISAAGGGGGVSRSSYERLEGETLVGACSITGASFSKRPIFLPCWLDAGGLSVQTVRLYGSRPAGTSLNMTAGLAFYSLSNATRIDLVSSTSMGISLTASSQFSGIRAYEFTGGLSTFTLSQGHWVMGVLFSGSNNSTAVANLVLLGGQTHPNVVGSVHAGTNSTGATVTSNHLVPFWGVYSATSGGFPSTVGRSQIAGQASNVAPEIYALIKGM